MDNQLAQPWSHLFAEVRDIAQRFGFDADSV